MPRCQSVGAACCRRFALGGQLRCALALAGTLLFTVADNVPALNVEAGCRAAAKMGDSLSLDATLRQCLADENSARGQLEKQWTQFPLALRQRCLATTETGGDPSYVEVLVCLQMGRDAAQMEDPLGGSSRPGN
jgi:hypothetical protein